MKVKRSLWIYLAYIHVIFVLTENGCYESMCRPAEIHRRYALSYLHMEYIIDSSKVYRSRRQTTLCRVDDIQRAYIRHYRPQRRHIGARCNRRTLLSLPASRVHCKSPRLKGRQTPFALSIRRRLESRDRPLDTNMSKSTIIQFQRR